MGAVRIDVHKRENTLQQMYPIASIQGVVSFFENIHHIRLAKFSGDIDALIMVVDFEDAIEDAGLSMREAQVLILRYERELTQKETADELGISTKSVDQFGRRGCEKIAKTLQLKGGYNDVIQ